MSLQVLPLELISIIVDEFKEDKQSLKTISLVSPPFLNACRTHLFTVLRINTLNPSFDYKCGAWDSFLRRSSALLPYIRVLELGPPVFRLGSRDHALCSSHWTSVLNRGLPSIHDERIQFIMAGVTNVQTVTLRFEFQSWRSFSPDFQGAVLDLIKRESVSSLSIEDVVDFPFQSFGDCRRLRDLSLISVVAPQQQSNEIQHKRGPIDYRGHLDSLTAIASDQCIASLVDVLSRPSSSLDLSCSDGRNALSKVPVYTASITTLELRLNSEKEYDLCDLKRFPNLCTLFISGTYSRSRRPIFSLSRFLSRSGKSSKLEELKILLRQDVPEFEAIRSTQELERICMSRDWRELEQKLTIRCQFPALRKMSLAFRPKDMTIFLNEYLTMSLHLCLVQAMPTLYALTNPTIEVYDDRFEQYIQD
ncbi:hypothetical protein CPB84DRAFT_1763787 [Gymnopilus junonius]|uniref:Uncharacterized protein n=1 Tax=Gymnopilus junonius TaxID=109634 RepID=A0A9P5P0U0_GYMJU|nr:hypothetical protein CPB84DRAFT_1763787 [Gymnopilus junonius]